MIDSVHVFDSMQSSIATLKVSSLNRCSPCVERGTSSQRTSPCPSATAAASATSPVPVPTRSAVVHKLSSELRVASAASCGRSVSCWFHLCCPLLVVNVCITIQCQSIFLSRWSTAAATCSWFAAELSRRWQIWIDSCRRHLLAVDRHLLLAPEHRTSSIMLWSKGWFHSPVGCHVKSLDDAMVAFGPFELS